MKLSLLNIVDPSDKTDPARYVEELLALARAADEYLFHRYWVGEHHTWIADSAPLVLIQAIAGATRRLRVGSGGILARYASPRQILEHFSLLSVLHPGRIDLGLCGGLVAPDIANGLLSPGAAVADFIDVAGRTITISRSGLFPLPTPSPELWLLGSGGRTRTLADERAVSYCHSLFHTGPSLKGALPRGALEARPLSRGSAIAVAGRCATSEAEALQSLAHFDSSYVLPLVVGSAQQCIDGLSELAFEYGADEVFFLDLGVTHAQRLESVHLLGECLSRQ